MSKPLKELIAQDYSRRLEGVEEALLVNVIGVNAEHSVALRRTLRAQGIQLLVVKNSLARRATEGTPLAKAFEGMEGTNAIVWGAADVISLAKVVVKIEKDYEELLALFNRHAVRYCVVGGYAFAIHQPATFNHCKTNC